MKAKIELINSYRDRNRCVVLMGFVHKLSDKFVLFLNFGDF
jgi:hypothetical protein